MRKNTLKRAFAALAVSAVAVSASAMSVFAEGVRGEQKYETDLDVSQATVKPTISLTQETISLEEAKKNPVRHIELTVSGAELKYCATGLHIEYDQSLSIVKNKVGQFATLGEAGMALAPAQEGNGTHGFFVTTGGQDNLGLDGVLWSFDLQLPDDVKAGQIFPIEIHYTSEKTHEDLFTNRKRDAEGELMMAWTFTNGIEHGYIQIEGETTTTTTSTTTTTTTTTTTSTTTTTTTTTTTNGSTSKAATTAAKTTTTKAKTTAKATDSPKTGVAGAGIAVAGLAIAVGTAFALRKKED